MSTPTRLDELKSWTLHRAGEEPKVFGFKQNGQPRDMTGATVVFKVAGGPTIQLVRHPTETNVMLLEFTLADLAAIPPRGAEYYIKDETLGRVIVDGKVFAKGFA